jgi:hypothetical protein
MNQHSLSCAALLAGLFLDRLVPRLSNAGDLVDLLTRMSEAYVAPHFAYSVIGLRGFPDDPMAHRGCGRPKEQNLSGMGGLEDSGGLLELDANLGSVKPDNLACPALPVCQCELELRGNAVRGLHLETRSRPRQVPDCARNAPASEKNLPGFQHPQTLGRPALLHALAREETLQGY